jgi:hypothetical protein
MSNKIILDKTRCYPCLPIKNNPLYKHIYSYDSFLDLDYFFSELKVILENNSLYYICYDFGNNFENYDHKRFSYDLGAIKVTSVDIFIYNLYLEILSKLDNVFLREKLLNNTNNFDIFLLIYIVK